MTRKPKPLPPPFFWSPQQAASALGRSVSWLLEHEPRLQQVGFPKRDAEVNAYPRLKIEAWARERNGISEAMDESNIEKQMIEAARGNP